MSVLLQALQRAYETSSRPDSAIILPNHRGSRRAKAPRPWQSLSLLTALLLLTAIGYHYLRTGPAPHDSVSLRLSRVLSSWEGGVEEASVPPPGGIRLQTSARCASLPFQ
ncbi:MAG: hypothetical protein HQM02_04715 [Magnetococcales bacterium]|nr:hypothetical protein [Magnetococcales bacterium]